MTVTSAILVKSQAQIRIYNDAVFRVNGTLTVQGQAKINIETCGSKLEIYGSYAGVSGKCEINYYCDTCASASAKPYELIWGTESNRSWCCEPALPVELVDFSGENYINYNILTWITASEINNDYFTLERSVDAIQWKPIAHIPGVGDSYTLQYYNYLDYNINKTYYYRLKQTDLNGTFKYLRVEVVTYRFDVVRKEIYRINTAGQQVTSTYKGLIIKIYDDGTSEKIIQQ
jgi:hypothetical protein